MKRISRFVSASAYDFWGLLVVAMGIFSFSVSPLAYSDIDGHCVAFCDEPSSSDSSGGGSYSYREPNYDSGAYKFGQRIRHWMGLSSIYDYESMPRAAPTKGPNRLAYDANEKGVSYYKNKDWDRAILAYQEALRYTPDDPVIQKNLRNAQAQQQMAYQGQLRESRLKDASARINQMLSEFSGEFSTSETIGSSGLTFREDFSDPSVVDLRDAKTLTVDPAKVTGESLAPQQGLVANPKAEAILDALDEGKGDWEASVKFLEKAVAAHPKDEAVHDAKVYVEGLHEYLKYQEGKGVVGKDILKKIDETGFTQEIANQIVLEKQLRGMGFNQERAAEETRVLMLPNLRTESKQDALEKQLRGMGFSQAQARDTAKSLRQPRMNTTQVQTAIKISAVLGASGNYESALSVLRGTRAVGSDDSKSREKLDELITNLERLQKIEEEEER